MLPLLRHIDQTSCSGISPRPSVLREHIGAVAAGFQALLAAAWRCTDAVWNQEVFGTQSLRQAGPRTAPRRHRRTTRFT